jgi:hypothetical protein
MSNEMVGIAGVLALTFLLLLLLHFFLSFGGGKKSPVVRPKVSRGNYDFDEEGSHEDGWAHEDAWLLWKPEIEQSNPPNSVQDELAERRAHAEKKGSSQL